MALRLVPQCIIALPYAGDARPEHIKVSGYKRSVTEQRASGDSSRSADQPY